MSLLTRRYGIRGYATSVHTACASGGQALGTAMKLIRRGAVDRVLAGGFDSMISPIGHRRLLPPVRALARQRHAGAREPAVRCDAQRLPAGRRRGLPRARGMGAARARAARASTPSSPATAIRCRAIASPTRRPTATGRSRRCARRSPTPARTPADVDYINAHGTSTGMNDRSETRGDPRGVRRRRRRASAVSSTKSTMGHLIAAAGAVEVRRLRARDRSAARCRSTRTYASATPTATSTSSSAQPRRQRVRMALSNSFGFGGSNSCVVAAPPGRSRRHRRAADA